MIYINNTNNKSEYKNIKKHVYMAYKAYFN